MDLYVILQIIIVSIAATSAMTLFSYAVSASFRELFKEPLLLNYFLHNSGIKLSNTSKNTLSWLFHYGIGAIFVTVYHYFWTQNIVQLSFSDAFLLGVVSGVISILSWMIFFEISHYQPPINFRGFYLQLFAAHLIFAFTATAVYAISLTIALVTNVYLAPK